MRPILLLLALACFAASAASAQNNCPQYAALMENARTYWGKGDYDKALKQLTAAREHCPEKGAEVDAQLIAFTRQIADKYKEADTQKTIAQRQAAAARAATDKAQRQALAAYANDLAYKSKTALRDGDRNAAFRLAEFAHRYVEADNPSVLDALLKALYYNDHPDTTHRLPRPAALEGHSSGVLSIAFSPDGKTFATGSEDNTAKIWDIKSGKAIIILDGHKSAVRSVVFSPDGKTLATGSWDRTAKIWDSQSGKVLSTLEDHTEGIRSIAFSPDGRTLATGSEDETTKIWDIADSRFKCNSRGGLRG